MAVLRQSNFRDLSLDDRAFFNRPNRLARFSIESKHETLFRILNQCRNALAINREVHQHRRSREVIVPLVAMMNLEMPAAFTCFYIESKNTAAE